MSRLSIQPAFMAILHKHPGMAMHIREIAAEIAQDYPEDFAAITDLHSRVSTVGGRMARKPGNGITAADRGIYMYRPVVEASNGAPEAGDMFEFVGLYKGDWMLRNGDNELFPVKLV